MLWYCNAGTKLEHEMEIKTCVALKQWSVTTSSRSVMWATANWWMASGA